MNICSISALAIWSKSSGTVICPAMKPRRFIWRGISAFANGCSTLASSVSNWATMVLQPIRHPNENELPAR